jgi:hypothetical protein
VTLPGPQVKTLDQCGSEVIKSNESNFSSQLHSPFTASTPTRALSLGAARRRDFDSVASEVIEGDPTLVAFRVMVGM